MHKKGFVLIETLIVTSVLCLCLIGLYTSYMTVNKRAALEKNYNNINNLYKTYYLRDNINTSTDAYITKNICETYMASGCQEVFDLFEVNYIVISTDISKIKSDTTSTYKNTLKRYLETYDENTTGKKIIIEFTKLNEEYYTLLNYYK